MSINKPNWTSKALSKHHEYQFECFIRLQSFSLSPSLVSVSHSEPAVATAADHLPAPPTPTQLRPPHPGRHPRDPLPKVETRFQIVDILAWSPALWVWCLIWGRPIRRWRGANNKRDGGNQPADAFTSPRVWFVPLIRCDWTLIKDDYRATVILCQTAEAPMPQQV